MAREELKIIIAGCGPGSAGYVTMQAHTVVAQAQVLVGAHRLLDLFPPGKALRIVVGGDIPAIIEAIDLHWRNRQTVVLVTGDPGLSSLATPVIKHFGRNNCEVIAGVSSIQVAFARIGLDWLDAKIITIHGRTLQPDFAGLQNVAKMAVLGGQAGMQTWLAGLLQFLGEKNYRVFVCENLTLDNERIYEVADTAKEAVWPDVATRSVILIIKGELLS